MKTLPWLDHRAAIVYLFTPAAADLSCTEFSGVMSMSANY